MKSTLKEKNLLLDPFEMGVKNENGRVASPESVLIHLRYYVLKHGQTIHIINN